MLTDGSCRPLIDRVMKSMAKFKVIQGGRHHDILLRLFSFIYFKNVYPAFHQLGLKAANTDMNLMNLKHKTSID